MNRNAKNRPDSEATEQARHELGRAETGDPTSADRLHQAEDAEPAAEAIEQEASDGPDKRGVSR